jgi:hypothetical protein
MLTRRTFLGTTGAGVVGATVQAGEPAAAPPPPAARKKMAVVTTEWRYLSHAWHMAERFLVGYPLNGRWHRPPFDVVSAYVDQTPANDLSKKRAREFGFTVYPKVAQALRYGGDRLAVDAVLIIGEHGDYPTNKLGQKLYPRYEFFQQAVEVFKKDGRTTPVFNDKHLSLTKSKTSDSMRVSPATGTLPCRNPGRLLTPMPASATPNNARAAACTGRRCRRRPAPRSRSSAACTASCPASASWSMTACRPGRG